MSNKANVKLSREEIEIIRSAIWARQQELKKGQKNCDSFVHHKYTERINTISKLDEMLLGIERNEIKHILVDEVRREVKVFAIDMEEKLKLNDHKKGWHNCSDQQLLAGLKREVEELEKAVNYNKTHDTIFECADVANYAMMIHNITVKAMLRDAGISFENLKKRHAGIGR